jgi:hypothetical protein
VTAPWKEWPDWRGETVAVIASGPSAKSVPLKEWRGRVRVIAIKENVDLCPWADVVYGCEAAWWRSRRGLPEFKGLRVAWDKHLGTEYGQMIRFIDIMLTADRILTEKPGTIGSGGNSGFQAVNLAVQWGAKRIALIGFDMHDRAGVHWYGRATGMGRANPGEWNFRRWRAAFDASAVDFARLGVEVVNLSQYSDLRGFPKWTWQALADAWRLCAACTV